MGIVLDLVIIGIILISVFLGYKKGLISLGIHLVATLAAIVITVMLYRPIGNIVISKTEFDENIQNVIETNVNDMIDTNTSNKMVENLIQSAKEGVLPEVSNSIAKNMVYAATALVLFLVSKVVLSIISAIANFVSKLPILNQFNKMGGIIYGVIRGLIIVYVVLMIISFINTFNVNGRLNKAVNSSNIARVMSTHNIFLEVFK